MRDMCGARFSVRLSRPSNLSLLRSQHTDADHLISHVVLWGMSMAVYPPGPASAGIDMQANGSLPVIPLYLPVPRVMMCVPQFISGCDLSVSRVSKVEKIWSPSLSVNTQAPSMYFLSPDATLSAAQRADILSRRCLIRAKPLRCRRD